MKSILSGLAISILVVYGYNYLKNHNRHYNQNKIEKRALILQQKECYTGQDIEYIIYGEIQE